MDAEDEDADDAEAHLYELPPPWASDDGAFAAIEAHRKPLKRLFASAAAPSAPPPPPAEEGAYIESDEEKLAEAAVLTGVARAADAVHELGKLSDLYSEPLSRDLAMELFARAQAEHTAYVDAKEGLEMVVDFDDFLTFLWLCLKLKFGPRNAEGFGAKVKGFLDSCPELVPPKAAEPEPEPEPEAPKKKKK